MTAASENKSVVNAFIDAVWRNGELSRLGEFWTADCRNHAASPGAQEGLEALKAYHEGFGAFFAAFSDLSIDLAQQVAEGDRVVTQIVAHGKHTGEFMGCPATGREVTLHTIRIDRLEERKIAEHWSVADMAGLVSQISA